jgi:hypothetical protein
VMTKSTKGGTHPSIFIKDVVEAEVADRGPARVVDLREVLKKILAGKRAA